MVKGLSTMASLATFCLLAVLLAVQAADDCDPLDVVAPCAAAYTGGSPPSRECCDKLKEQGSCYCSYIKNPAFAPYIDSPNGKKIIAACGFKVPTCPKPVY